MVSFNDIGLRSTLDRAGASWQSSINSFGAGIMPDASDGGDYLCSYLAGGLGTLLSAQMVQNFSQQFARFGSLAAFFPGAGSAIGAASSAVAGGMALGFVAPPVAAPVFGGYAPVAMSPVAPSAPAAAPSGGTSIHAGSDGDKVSKSEKPDAAKKTEEIEKIEKQYRNTLTDKGYSEPLLSEIINDAKTAAAGEPNQFKRILNAVPSRKFTEPTTADDGSVSGKSIKAQQQQWVRDFGKWHTEQIGKVGDDKVRTQIVNDVAGVKSDATYSVTFAPEKQPEKGQKRYQVSEVKGTGDLEKGAYVYFNENTKKWYYDQKMTREIAAPAEKQNPGQTASFTVPGASDYLNISSAGTEQRSNGTQVDRFRIDGAVGKDASKASESANGDYVYRTNDGKWLYKDANGKVVKLEDVEYINSRLYFKRGGGALDPSFASPERGVEYISGLRAEEKRLTDHSAKLPEGDKAQRKERAEKTIADYKATIPQPARDKVTLEYNAEKNELIVNCAAENCREVTRAMGAGDKSQAAGDMRTKRNAILHELPAGTKVYVNPGNPPAAKDQVELGDEPATNICKALANQTPRRLGVEGAVDLSNIAKQGSELENAIGARLNTAIADAKKSQTTPNPSEIDFTGEVKLPEGKIDSAAWERIRTQVSDANGKVPVHFANVINLSNEGDGYKVQRKNESTNVQLNNIQLVRQLKAYGATVNFDGTNVVVTCDAAHKAEVQRILETADPKNKKEFNDGINKILAENQGAKFMCNNSELTGADKHAALLAQVKAMTATAAPATAVDAATPNANAGSATQQQPGSDAVKKFIESDVRAKDLKDHGCEFVYDAAKKPPELQISIPNQDYRKYAAYTIAHVEDKDADLATIAIFNQGLKSALPAGSKVFFDGRELQVAGDNYWDALAQAARSMNASAPAATNSTAQKTSEAQAPASVSAAAAKQEAAQDEGTLKIANGYDFAGSDALNALSGEKLENAIFQQIEWDIKNSETKNPSMIDLSESYIHVVPGKVDENTLSRIQDRLSKKFGNATIRMPEVITDEARFKQAYANTVLQNNPLVKQLADSGVTVTYYRENNTVVVTCPPDKVEDAQTALSGEFDADLVDQFNAAIPADAELTFNGKPVGIQNEGYYAALEQAVKNADDNNASHTINDPIDLSNMIFEHDISHDKKRDRIVTAMVAEIFEAAKKQGVALRGNVDVTHIQLPKDSGMTVDDWQYITNEVQTFFSRTNGPLYLSFNRDEIAGQLARGVNEKPDSSSSSSPVVEAIRNVWKARTAWIAASNRHSDDVGSKCDAFHQAIASFQAEVQRLRQLPNPTDAERKRLELGERYVERFSGPGFLNGDQNVIIV